MAGAVELLRAGEPGRARSRRRRRCGPSATAGGCGTIQPSSQPRADDRELDLLDRDGVALVDLEHAGGLARRGAEAAGELGEVVRAVQLVERLAEAVAVDEVVPVGDEVAERAAAVAERHAALHAARALLAAARRAAASCTNSRWSPTRSAGGRSGVSARASLRKAPSSPMAYAAASVVSVSAVRKPSPPVESGRSLYSSAALVVVRDHLDEARERRLPVGEQPGGDGRGGAPAVLLDERAERLGVVAGHRLEADELAVAAQPRTCRPRRGRRRCRRSCRRRSSVPSGRAPTTTPPVMYSQPWSPTPSTTASAPELRTAKRSPTTPAEERAAGRGAVEDRVPGDHVLLRPEAGARRAAAGRARRRRGPCRRSRSRRRRASARFRARARPRTTGRPRR